MLAPSAAWADIVKTQSGTILKLYTYDDHGATTQSEGSDITVFFDTGLSECPDGTWISPADPGYQNMTSFLLTAYTTKTSLSFQVYNDRIWPGSNVTKLCKVDAIKFD